MSIRVKNTKINYPNQVIPTGYTASISYFIKFNNTIASVTTIIAQTNNYVFYDTQNSYTINNKFFDNGGFDSTYSSSLGSGNVAHCARVIDNGTYKFYVNGVLCKTEAGTFLRGGNKGLYIGNSATDFEIDDFAIWQGYALNQADVFALRDKTSGAVDIARSSLQYYMTMDGTIGSSANTSSSGIKSRGNVSDSPSTIDAGGSVTFTSGLNYASNFFIDQLRVGPSSGTILISFKNGSDVPTNVNSIVYNPTITVNGTTTINLTGAIWSTYMPYIIYPVTGIALAPTDTITLSTPTDWIGSSSSFAIGSTDVPVDTSYMGGTFLPTVPTGNRTMKLGYNLDYLTYYNVVCPYANVMEQGSHVWGVYQGGGSVWNDSNYNLTGVSAGTTAHKFISRCDSDNGFDSKTYPSLISGTYNLEWSGAGDCSLSDWGQNLNYITFLSSGYTSDPNIKFKKYRAQNNTATTYRIDMNVTSTRAPVYNVNVYHEDNRGYKWDRRVISQISGSRALRGLLWLNINNSNLYMESDYDNNPTLPKALRAKRSKSLTITNVSGMTNISGYFIPAANNIYMNIETNNPHEMVDGTFCAVTINNLKLLPSGSVNVYIETQIKKLSDTRFGISYQHTANSFTVSGSQAPASTAVTYTAYHTAGYDEFIDLSNYLGTEPWILVPHMAQDILVQRIASGVRSKLPVGGRVHVEYTNEHWNFGLYFQQSYYCYGKGAEIGIGQTQYYTRRAAQVHTIFRNIFAEQGRQDEVIRTFGSQAANLNVTTDIINYAHSNSIVVDEIAIAPYWGVTPDGSNLSSAYDRFDHNRLMDVAEMSVQYDCLLLGDGSAAPYATYISGHKSILNNRFVSGKLVCYEGGLEMGIGRYSSLSAANHATRNRNFQVNPRIRPVMNYFFNRLQNAGVETMTYFQHAGTYLNSLYLWSVYTSAYQQPGKGDGTDGLFDNRTDINNLQKLVSPVGKAISDWQYYYDAYNPRLTASTDTDTDITSNGFYIIFQPSKGDTLNERNGVFVIGTPDEELFGTYFVQGKRKLLERPNNY